MSSPFFDFNVYMTINDFTLHLKTCFNVTHDKHYNLRRNNDKVLTAFIRPKKYTYTHTHIIHKENNLQPFIKV